jgi:hypothetical protein
MDGGDRRRSPPQGANVAFALDERALEIAADRVQLVAAVERDDADAAVDGIGHEGRGHGGSFVARVSAG